jgi:ABC-type transporter Mla MlaB component
MFRAQVNQLASGPTLKMEGNLVGAWAEEAKSLVTSGPVPKGLIVDLADVRQIDSVGEQVLVWLARVGSSFIPNGLYAAAVCERLQLPIHGKATRSRKHL